MASDAQYKANRENAQKSHGPTSESGFDRCRTAPMTHGLTARVITMTLEDKESYEKSMANTFSRLSPVTDPEIQMAQFIGDQEWKLARAFIYEQGMAAKARAEAKHMFGPDFCDPEERETILMGHIQQTNSKFLLNMSSEYSRVERSIEKRIAAYEKLRRERELFETAQRNVAMQSIIGKASEPCIPEPTVGTLYPIPFLIARLDFAHGVGSKNVFTFDRVWSNPKVRPPSLSWPWGELTAKPPADGRLKPRPTFNPLVTPTPVVCPNPPFL